MQVQYVRQFHSLLPPSMQWYFEMKQCWNGKWIVWLCYQERPNISFERMIVAWMHLKSVWYEFWTTPSFISCNSSFIATFSCFKPYNEWNDFLICCSFLCHFSLIVCVSCYHGAGAQDSYMWIVSSESGLVVVSDDDVGGVCSSKARMFATAIPSPSP